MKDQWIQAFGIAVAAIVLTALPASADENQGSAAAGPAPVAGIGACGGPASDTVPEPIFLGGKCMFCESSPASFKPRFGEICDYAGTCEQGSNSCCNYTCRCGVSDGGDPVPAAACLPLNDPGCCPQGSQVCEVSYCGNEGVRCVANGCGVGCCLYGCGPDPTCTAPDPIPSTAC